MMAKQISKEWAGVKDSPEMVDLKSNLAHFNGTEQYYKGSFTLNYTDGVKAFHELAKAYWLITDLSMASKMKFNRIPFQVWKLTVNKDHKAVLTMQEDSGAPILYKQYYDYTDMPVGTFELWVESGVLILPSEH